MARYKKQIIIYNILSKYPSVEKLSLNETTNYINNRIFIKVLNTVNPFIISHSVSSEGTQQNRTFTGKVTDSNGDPIIGASVLVKSTANGTVTDMNGEFSIQTSVGSTLVISYVGYTKKEITIQSATFYNIVLVEDSQLLGEVIVTAMGIKKEKKALGYAVQDIKSEELLKNKNPNIINSLAGKIAGVNVTQSGGGAGSGATILLRGGTSLERDNQPLFIVDGIIYDNGTDIGGNSGFDGAQATNSTYSNRVMDINPEDVESMSVLKGPAAAALYGSRAAAGVIIVTTKKGKEGKVEVNLSTKLSTQWANSLPKQQRLYKRGEYTTQGVLDESSTLTSWGAPYGNEDVYYNNIKDFFRNSLTWDNNLSISGGSEKGTFFFSISRFNQDGIIPETDYNKNTFRFNGEQRYGKLTVGANAAYSVADAHKSLTSGGLYNSGGTGAMVSVYRWPGSEDMRLWLNEDGTKYRMFPGQLLASDIDNPYWIVNRNRVKDKTTRFTGNFKLSADIFDWWNVSYTAGTDRYTTETRRVIEAGSGVSLLWQRGMVSENDYTYEYLTSNFMMSFNKTIHDFDLNLLVGNSVEDIKSQSYQRMGWNFVVDEFYSINNTAETDRKMTQSKSRKRLVGTYGEFRVGYKSLAYLTVTGRNDWTSTLPVENRSYFYPSVGGSLVFSELLPENTLVSFGKLRASWAKVGKDADPYVTNTYLWEPDLTIGGNGLSNYWTKGNPTLIPETTKSIELGLEMRFLNGRIGFDFTYYSNKSYNQLLSPRASQANGYIFMTTNAADITNKGMELSVNATPVKTTHFEWEATLNLSGNRGKVNDLLDGIEILYVTDTQVGTVKSASFNNGDFMALAGSKWDRDPDGNVILDAKTGMPTYDGTDNHYIGNREPKLLGGFNNSLTYKNWNLSFLLDFRVGGLVYNGTEYFMTGQGTSIRSADRESITISGVTETIHADDSRSYTPATYNFHADKYYDLSDYGQEVGVDDPNRISGKNIIRSYYSTYYGRETSNYATKTNWLRLRSISLGYTFPP